MGCLCSTGLRDARRRRQRRACRRRRARRREGTTGRSRRWRHRRQRGRAAGRGGRPLKQAERRFQSAFQSESKLGVSPLSECFQSKAKRASVFRVLSPPGTSMRTSRLSGAGRRGCGEHCDARESRPVRCASPGGRATRSDPRRVHSCRARLAVRPHRHGPIG